MQTREAIALAESKELDLIEISSTSEPPVCKISDYGKFRYEQQKRENLAKKNQHQQQMKEIRLHPRTDKHDVNFKLTHAREFLGEGDKVKFTVIFKGREMAHQDIGRQLLSGILEALKDESKIDSPIKMEGRNMSLVLSPDKKNKKTEDIIK
jgi:translation initiation factor IF-3